MGAPIPWQESQRAFAEKHGLVLSTLRCFPAEIRSAVSSPLPHRLIEKGLPGVGLLPHLVPSRFDDHLPFFRQERIFAERFGVRIPRQTMVGWIEMMAGWFESILGKMKEAMIATGYFQVDETVIRYLDREEPAKSLQGDFWVYAHRSGTKREGRPSPSARPPQCRSFDPPKRLSKE